jgi:hypothetical protein
MIAGHHRTIKPSIIHRSLQSLARSLGRSANLNCTKMWMKGQDSFGKLDFAVESGEGDFGWMWSVFEQTV